MDYSRIVNTRQDIIIKKAKQKTKKPTTIDFFIELLFDPYFFRNTKKYIDYKVLKKQLETNLDCIEILFPIFSRKPISPIKNCGYYADIAEIYSILKMASFSKIANNFVDKVTFSILADGKKYNRACKTPDVIVEKYQKSIQFWIDYFKFNHLIHLDDYETRTHSSIGDEHYLYREESFVKKYKEISSLFDRFFDPIDIANSMKHINANTLGNQLHYTFYSILSSINYSKKLDYLTYIHYIASLHYKAPKQYKEQFIEMRKEAWEAAKKYVAISLLDRELNIIKAINPSAIKFTIHAKPNELRFIDSPLNSFNLTAQHCVGGINIESNKIKINFDYRICREHRKEKAVCISRLEANKANFGIYDYLVKMSNESQPIYFERGVV